VLAISLASLFGCGPPLSREKHAALNLRLSGIRGGQASAVETACVYLPLVCSIKTRKNKGRRSAPLGANRSCDLQLVPQNWKRTDNALRVGRPRPAG